MTNKILQKYKKLGWEFKTDRDISPHNGDIDDELLVKSPRLKEFFCVASARHAVPTWDEVKESDMLRIENAHYAQQRWEEIEWDIENLVIQAIKRGKDEIKINLKKL